MKITCFDKIILKIRSNISGKFIVTFLLFLIIPLILLTQIFTYQIRNLLMNKEKLYVSEKINIASNQVNEIFQDMNSIIISLNMNTNVINTLKNSSETLSFEWFKDYKELQNSLSFLASNLDYQYQITILSSDNKRFQIGAYYNSVITLDHPLMKSIKETGNKANLINRKLEGYDDNPVITLGQSIYERGNFLGIILVEVPTLVLDNILNPYEREDTKLYVLQNNKIIYTTDSTFSVDISELLLTSFSEKKDFVELKGKQYMMTSNEDKKSGIHIIALVTKDSVFKESSNILFLFIIGFVCIILATVLGIFKLTSVFSYNIRKLNKEVSRFGNQVGFDIVLPVKSPDEVGQLTLGVIAMSQRINHLLEQIKENERNKRILEFQGLQAQINPHMIYNTLNTITYLAELQNINNIKEVSSSFANLLKTISNSKGEFLTIKEEIEYLKAYIAIKKYNLLCDIETIFQVDESVLECKILKLILQPIVENALIHGFMNRIEDGLLTIRIYIKHDRIIIDVMDNGEGMKDTVIQSILLGKEKSHNTFLRVGVNNVIQRLKLQYGEDTIFKIISYEGVGTTIHMEYPLCITGVGVNE